MQAYPASGSLPHKTGDDIEDDGYNRSEVKDMPRERKKAKTHAILEHRKPDEIINVSKDNGKGKGKATTQIYKGRNVGKLAKLLEMPIDIFCEISRYLGPLDLLQLLRSTKSFNQILMSRDSKPIWRVARSTYPDLPDCPSDMSEPEYARLIFLKECHVCLIKRAMKADYQLRTRLCSGCRASHVERGDVLLQTIPGLTEELLECLPSKSIGRFHAREWSYKIAAERIVSQYNKAVPLTLSDEEAQKAKSDFIQSRKALLLQIPHNVRQLSKWASNQVDAKQISDNETIKRRQKDIHTKLLELGYSAQDIPPLSYSVEWNNILYRPRDLTPRIWTNIRPKLENQIASYTRTNRQHSRRSELWEHLSILLTGLVANNPELYFPVNRAITFPICVTVMEENDFGNVITEEKCTEIKDQVLNEIYAVIEESENSLISTITSLDPELIPKSLTIPEEVNKEFIMASTTYFACNECGSGWSYPMLRRHICLGIPTEHYEAGFAFDPLRTAVAQKLLASLPEVDDTDDVADKFIKCSVCLVCMRWSELLRHFYPEDMRHPPGRCISVHKNCHTLEGAIQKVGGRPLIIIEDDEDGNEKADENGG